MASTYLVLQTKSVIYNTEKDWKKIDPKLPNLEKSNTNFLSMNENALALLLLYGDRNMPGNNNIFLLNAIFNYILSTKRFDKPLNL